MSVYMRDHESFLYDTETHDIVGVKFPNGREMLWSQLSSNGGYVDSVVPDSGGNASFRSDSNRGTLLIKPATNIAAANIVLPPDNVSAIGQDLFVVFYKSITTTTVLNGVIMGDPETGDLGDVWHIKKLESNMWGKIK